MSTLDWVVLDRRRSRSSCSTACGRAAAARTSTATCVADRSMPWHHVALSIMATQASAITFLSTPGQAYADGMRFVQFYFGLPIAMVILARHRGADLPPAEGASPPTSTSSSASTLKTRTLAALLFLVAARARGRASRSTRRRSSSRSSSAGTSTGDLPHRRAGHALHDVGGGTNAVEQHAASADAHDAGRDGRSRCPRDHRRCRRTCLSPTRVSVAGALGRLNAIDFTFDLDEPLQLLVGTHRRLLPRALLLRHRSVAGAALPRRASRSRRAGSGLLFNGLVKVPMQFFILFARRDGLRRSTSSRSRRSSSTRPRSRRRARASMPNASARSKSNTPRPSRKATGGA